MSNKPKMTGPKNKSPKFQKLKTPVRIRMYHHVGDMAGCGTIRIIQPAMILNNYFSKKHQFESLYNNRYLPYLNAYKDCSIVTFQRSATEQNLNMIQHFKENNRGKAAIYEIDDDLFNIPEWNFASGYYKENRKWIEEILRTVDGIVCSTPHLKKLLSKYNRNINVSPNHLPKFIWGDVQETVEDIDRPRIMYAGSHNHFDTKGSSKGDFSPELIDFVSKTTDIYQWIFVGGIPESLKGDNKIQHFEWKPVVEYPSFLKYLEPDICLAPLEDNMFNKSKSNIKALESVALGAPLLASDLEPYKGIPHLCSGPEEMISKIENLANNPDLRLKVWRDQYKVMKDQLFWEDNNHANLLDYVNQHLRLFRKEL